MKKLPFIRIALAAFALAPLARADDHHESEHDTNRLSLSVRFGLNISARFTSAGSLSIPIAPRLTPNGQLYNYDDGYLLTDISGNAGGQTWYWGYDDNVAQVSGNNILLSRTTTATDFASPSLDSDPSPGVELAYARQLGHLRDGEWHWGVEAAVNYQNLDLSDNSSYGIAGLRTTDAYPFTPGTTPPAATPSSPYQGSFGGPGFVVGASPVSTTTSTVADAATVNGQREFKADVWGFRLGPYVEIPARSNLNFSVSGGLAAAYVDGRAAWSETIIGPGGFLGGTGSSSDGEMLWGFYVAGTAQWRFNERWSAVGSVQYQNIGTYRRNAGARNVEVDLGGSVFLTLGLGYNF